MHPTLPTAGPILSSIDQHAGTWGVPSEFFQVLALLINFLVLRTVAA